MTSTSEALYQRRRLLVRGIVQGVGFRPFVYGQALQRQLVGFVLNDSNGVTIEIEGTTPLLDSFETALATQLPPLARVDNVNIERIPPRHDTHFVIIHSREGSERHALISPDTATCEQCLHELFDPADRRYLYPFINCTNCGPRFTIVRDVPYDRDKTTMSVFPMCPSCQHEYEDPLNRRFHAQPNACALCGPHVDFVTTGQESNAQNEPLLQAARAIMAGEIVAVKGLGGYHLACDARNEKAVQLLRQRKHREAKPFALMVADVATARLLCAINEHEETLLRSHRRPIVLLQRHPDAAIRVASAVAPVENTLGIMLPYTPLHHLLLHACKQVSRPDNAIVLVMTSGNLSDEPIAYQDDDAQNRLTPIIDGLLIHNRSIHMRCDDTVMRVTSVGEQFLRRSRGYAPDPLKLSLAFPVPLLACGGHLKNTFCLCKENLAFVSHHIGDLENLETLLSFREGIAHYQRLFAITPQIVAYDLHPEYLATKYALASEIPLKIGVQHHHAHIASVMAEHGLNEKLIGIAADGTGYGTDGAIWGCELMIADLVDFQRRAHLAYMPLPGGEQAVYQPWRMAAAYLQAAYGERFLDLPLPFVRQLDQRKWHTLAQMIAKNINCPKTSSLGRLFDAVAALVLHRYEVCYEGQAAIELEMCAATCTDQATSYPFSFQDDDPLKLDVLPTIQAISEDCLKGCDAALIAKRFHATIVTMFADLCLLIRERSDLDSVALSGGVFQNRLLLEQLVTHLQTNGFRVYLNQRVPTNDGGLCLGQAAIAAARWQLQQEEYTYGS